MLYRTETAAGGEAQVYLLLEHKSYADPLTPFQLLRYMVRIWERDAREGSPGLRPIVPIVLYHGREALPAPWTFADLYAGPEVLRAYWPAFAYELSDLSAYSDEEIVGAANLQIALRLMKHIFDHDLQQQLAGLLEMFHRLQESTTAPAYLGTVLPYVMAAAGQLSEQTLKETVTAAFAEEGSDIMQTIAERWIEQGREEGVRLTLVDLLTSRFGALPAVLQDRLESIHELDDLRRLVNIAAAAQSLAEFEAALP